MDINNINPETKNILTENIKLQTNNSSDTSLNKREMINASLQALQTENPDMSLDDIINEMTYYILPSQLSLYEYNPDDLVAKKGLYIYDRMKDDEIIKTGLMLKKLTILSKKQLIKPSSEDNEDIKIAKFVEWNLFNRLEKSFSSVLEQILTGMDYGYSISEKIYDVEKNNSEYRNKIILKNIKTKPPHGFSFQIDQFGNLLHLKQFKDTMYQGIFNPKKFVIYSHDCLFENYYGNSDLRAVYRPWWCKDTVLKFLAIHLERYGTPLLIAYYDNTIKKEEHGLINNLLKYLQTGSGFKLPKDKVNIDSINFQTPTGYLDAVNKYDTMITRGLLMPDQIGFTNTGSGSYALGIEQFGIFYLLLNKIAEDICEVVNKQVIKDLVDWNFLNVNKYPKMEMIDTTKDDLEKIAGTYATLTTTGYMSTSNKEDVNYVRRKFQLPEITNKDIKIQGQYSDTENQLNLSEDDNTKYEFILGDFISKEKELGEAINKSLKDIPEDTHKQLVEYYNNKQYNKLNKTIRDLQYNPLIESLQELYKQSYQLGKVLVR